MPFASQKNATDSKGNIKEGFKKITDKNGKIKYLSNVPAVRKSKDVKASKVKASKVKASKVKASKVSKVKDSKKNSPDVFEGEDPLTVSL